MAVLCAAGKRLRYECNVLYPHRDTASDGWLASAAHTANNPDSDHEPDAHGIVHAIDIDEDLLGRDGQDPKAANLLANQIVLKAHAGDDRIKYVIFEGRIASAKTGWKWKAFTGYSHPRHIHVSFTTAGDNDRRSFHLTK